VTVRIIYNMKRCGGVGGIDTSSLFFNFTHIHPSATADCRTHVDTQITHTHTYIVYTEIEREREREREIS